MKSFAYQSLQKRFLMLLGLKALVSNQKFPKIETSGIFSRFIFSHGKPLWLPAFLPSL